MYLLFLFSLVKMMNYYGGNNGIYLKVGVLI